MVAILLPFMSLGRQQHGRWCWAWRTSALRFRLVRIAQSLVGMGLLALVALERKERGQRVENLKAGIRDKLAWLLEGADHFLSRTDELPRSVTMKHANASWGTALQTSLSTRPRRNFEQTHARQIVIVPSLFPFHCKCWSYLLEMA